MMKRKRAKVSYKDPSSDDDFSGDSQKRHAVPSRRSTRHRQPESPHEEPERDDSVPPTPNRRPRQRARTVRRHHKVQYKDLSTDEESFDEDFEPDAEPIHTPRKNRSNAQPSRAAKSPGSKRQHRRLYLGAPLRPNASPKTDKSNVDVVSDNKIPAWASLPYHVLLQVFVYASHPLHDENMKATTSSSWLVKVARMCSTFTKPALTALYRNPPIFAMRQTRRDLVHHLITPPPEAHEDYQVMVKRLEIDVTQISSLTDSTHSVADLAALVSSLTTLRDIDIFDPIDRPPFRDRLRRLRRWVYPEELFEALRSSSLRLRSWRWNSTFCDNDALHVKSIHADAVFQGLRELSLTKFHPIVSTTGEEETAQGPTSEELLASALIVLPELRTLSFETCGIVSGRFLPLLPSNLVSLSITNCGELLSEALQAFLASHGSQLEELVLNHNQSLDISFLTDLKHACPKLEVLRMDMTYYSSLAMSSDNEPLYETLLGEHEIPTWPASLRIIDMEYLRHWNATSATNFFSSLIDSANELPWLRAITIVAMVDTDWRQRAEFRMKWSAKFKHVFARKWEAPSSHLVSLKAFREWQKQPHDAPEDKAIIAENSKQVAVQDHTDDSDPPSDVVRERKHKADDSWGAKRLRKRSKTNTNYDETTDSSPGSPEEATDEEQKLFVQGLCHTVLFRIDNFRPREEIFDEADFLDAEPSDDEEWNGNENNEVDEGATYAW